MLTNIPLLFILSLFMIFSLSQEDDCETNTTTTTTTTPISRNDCFARSVPNGYCCFDSSGSGSCKSIPREDLSKHPEYDCGITDEKYEKYEFGQYHPEQPSIFKELGFEYCGKSNPKKKKDCTDYSEISNSCCFFKIGNENACLHIGRKYIGNSKETSFSFGNYNDVKVECKSFNIIFNLYSILLIALLFL